MASSAMVISRGEPDGTVAVAGLDLLTVTADGRIQSSIAFFGDLPEA